MFLVYNERNVGNVEKHHDRIAACDRAAELTRAYAATSTENKGLRWLVYGPHATYNGESGSGIIKAKLEARAKGPVTCQGANYLEPWEE